jgi:hypothetical protein
MHYLSFHVVFFHMLLFYAWNDSIFPITSCAIHCFPWRGGRVSVFVVDIESRPLPSCITLIVTSLRLTDHIRLTNPNLSFPRRGELVFESVNVDMPTCTSDSLLPNYYSTEMHDSSTTWIDIAFLDVVGLTPFLLSILSQIPLPTHITLIAAPLRITARLWLAKPLSLFPYTWWASCPLLLPCKHPIYTRIVLNATSMRRTAHLRLA